MLLPAFIMSYIVRHCSYVLESSRDEISRSSFQDIGDPSSSLVIYGLYTLLSDSNVIITSFMVGLVNCLDFDN